MKLPHIKTLNSQIDTIERRTDESAARLERIEAHLARIAELLEKRR